MSKAKDIRLHFKPEDMEHQKNTTGTLGAKCNNCGGYGFTMKLGGGRLDCKYCEHTGVKEPTPREIQEQISGINSDLRELKEALLKTLVGQGRDLDAKEVKRSINV
jgi:hypothetical protein